MFQKIEGDDRLQMKAFTLLRDALIAKTEAGLIDEDDSI